MNTCKYTHKCPHKEYRDTYKYSYVYTCNCSYKYKIII